MFAKDFCIFTRLQSCQKFRNKYLLNLHLGIENKDKFKSLEGKTNGQSD